MSDIERRGGYVDIERIVAELAESVKEQGRQMHQHDRDIAVLQSQAQAGYDRTTAIEIAIREIYEKIEELSACFSKKLDALFEIFAAHTTKENDDRIKLLLAVVATLATGLASLAFEVLRR